MGVDLRYCSYDFPTPRPLIDSPPLPLYTVFVIDITMVAQNSGYLDELMILISKSMTNFEGDSRSLISFLFFDYSIKFLAYDEHNDKFSLITCHGTINELEPKFLPMIRLSVQKHGKRLIKRLGSIRNIISKTPSVKSCLGPTMKFLKDFLKKTGGNVWFFTFNSNTFGEFALSSKKPNQPVEQPVIASENYYHQIAYDFYKAQISINFIYLGQTYLDLPSLYPLIKVTGGKFKYFPGFNSNNLQILSEFRSMLFTEFSRTPFLATTTYLCLPEGLEVDNYYGNFFPHQISKYSSGTSDNSTSLFFTLSASRFPIANPIIQSVTMYYTPGGNYRTRVHTIKFSFESMLSKCYDSMNPLLLTAYLAKECADESFTVDMKDLKSKLVSTTTSIFQNYKKLQPSHLHSLGFLSPKTLKYFPPAILSLIKSHLFNFSNCRDYNLKHSCAMALLEMNYMDMMKYLCPLLFAIKSDDNKWEVTEICANEELLDRSKGHYIFITLYTIYLICPCRSDSTIVSEIKSYLHSDDETDSEPPIPSITQQHSDSLLPLGNMIDCLSNKVEPSLHLQCLKLALNYRLKSKFCYVLQFDDRNIGKILDQLVMGTGSRDLTYSQFVGRLGEMVE
ncbi:MAG: Protein transport protein Sec24B [Marteilia pararefringens]